MTELTTQPGSLVGWRFKTKPWASQRAALEWIVDHPASLIELPMGLGGKTKIAIDAICNLNFKLVLVVCPKPVMHVWKEQARVHASCPLHVCVLDTPPSTGARAAHAAKTIAKARRMDRQLVLVINYDSVWRRAMADVLSANVWDAIICDESHRIKSAGSKVSFFFSRLAKNTTRRIGLTGTPMADSPLDVYGQFRFLDRTVYDCNYTIFKKRFFVMGEYPRDVRKCVNVDEFRRLYRKITFTWDGEYVDLPEAVHTKRYVTLCESAARHYRNLEQEFVTELKNGLVTAANAAVKLLRLQQITSGFLKPEGANAFTLQVDDGKEKALTELLMDLPANEPVVVFSRFKVDIQTTIRAAKAAGRSYYELHGSRHELAEWQRASGGRVLAAQITTGKEGVEMTGARCCVYLSKTFSRTDYLQSQKRVHRPGQTRPVTYVHILAKGTVDQRVERALKRKESLIDSVLRGYEDVDERNDIQ